MPNKTKQERDAISRENGKLGGRPPKYETPEELDTKCQEYIALCKSQAKFPDEAGMLLYCDISWDTKNRYENNEDNKYPGFAEVLKKYATIRESELVQELMRNPKGAGAYAFLLKQVKNGGYTDKQQIESNGKQSIEVTLKTID